APTPPPGATPLQGGVLPSASLPTPGAPPAPAHSWRPSPHPHSASSPLPWAPSQPLTWGKGSPKGSQQTASVYSVTHIPSPRRESAPGLRAPNAPPAPGTPGRLFPEPRSSGQPGTVSQSTRNLTQSRATCRSRTEEREKLISEEQNRWIKTEMDRGVRVMQRYRTSWKASRREVRDREPESRRRLRKGEGHRAGCWPRTNKSNRENNREVEHEKRQGHIGHRKQSVAEAGSSTKGQREAEVNSGEHREIQNEGSGR
ncbi:unnamed protein product, partial [Bubo scandiacus]